MRKVKRACYSAAALAVALCLPALGALAKLPSVCVAELQDAYGSNSSLRAECDGKTDCTFQAPEGNASALALIDTIVKRAETCMGQFALSVTKEDKVAEGSTRYYSAPGAAETCALLVATSSGAPQGVRLSCQPVK